MIRFWFARFLATLALASMLVTPGYASGETVTLKVIIVSGVPGHSAVHLQRGSKQLYWDPGGFYGTEYDDCVEFNSVGACRRFAGFPWEYLKASRRSDVFHDDNAALLQILSIYHLDGDPVSEIYTLILNGTLADHAWHLLEEGRRLGRKARFTTDRQPMFCAKAVADYFHALGGDFEDMPRPWFPSMLATELRKRGVPRTRTYSIRSPAIRQFINETRLAAHLPALFTSLWTNDSVLVRETNSTGRPPGSP